MSAVAGRRDRDPLVAEPGVELDPFGRQLRRYVQLPSGADCGLSVIGASHTGVSERQRHQPELPRPATGGR